MKKKIFFLFLLLFLVSNLFLLAREKIEEPFKENSQESLKEYIYFIKKGGIYRFEKGGSDIEPYLLIGMSKSDIIKLNDVKTLYSLNYEYSGDRVNRIWITSEYIRTPDGSGTGSPISEFRKYQPVNIGGTVESYTPPYSGVVFCSNGNNAVDIILICSPEISGDLYQKASYLNQGASYIVNSDIKDIHYVMNEIIVDLYYSLAMNPCILNDVILLSSKEELGRICSLYGGNNYPVTSFCVNEAEGSVIYVLDKGYRDLKFKGILAHEYAHIWHYRYTGYYETDPYVSEGFAEWVRYHYEGQEFQYCSEKYYTDGLKRFIQIENEKGSEGVFKYILENS